MKAEIFDWTHLLTSILHIFWLNIVIIIISMSGNNGALEFLKATFVILVDSDSLYFRGFQLLETDRKVLKPVFHLAFTSTSHVSELFFSSHAQTNCPYLKRLQLIVLANSSSCFWRSLSTSHERNTRILFLVFLLLATVLAYHRQSRFRRVIHKWYKVWFFCLIRILLFFAIHAWA